MSDSNDIKPRPLGREIDVSNIRSNNQEDVFYIPTFSNLSGRQGEHWTRATGRWIDASTFDLETIAPTSFDQVRRMSRPDDEVQTIVATAYESYHARR